MTQHSHRHSALHRRPLAEESEPSAIRFHKDWRVWLAVGMMLAAIITYVLTLDDSIVPAIMGH
jgi:hypothetical protein